MGKKFRVEFSVVNPKSNSRTLMSATVEANSQFMAERIARNQLKYQSPSHRECSFSAIRIQQVG